MFSWRRRVALGCVFLRLFAHAADVPGDPGARQVTDSLTPSNAALGEGKARFEATCSACHGAAARGGRNGAADLLTSQLAQGDAARFREFVTHGSAERGMPGFSLDADVLDSIQAHLKSLAAAASRRGHTEIVIVGDVSRGRAYFEAAGHCVQCHSATGDLQGIGSRYPPTVVQGRLVLPRGNGVHPGLIALGMRIPGVTDGVSVKDAPRTVTVRRSGRKPVTGVLIAVSDFDVSLRDAEGRYVAFERKGDFPEVTINDPAQWHVDALGHISDDIIRDLTAYLVSLR